MSSVRTGGLMLALAFYGLFGIPAPGRLGWRETAVGCGLVLATGLGRPLLVGTGALLRDPGARLHDLAGTVAFNYLLWFPLLRGVLSGANGEDVYRDVVPLVFLFIPVLLVPGPAFGWRMLPLGLAAVGVLFSLRWWWPGLAFRQVGRFAMAEGDGYLLNSPAVLFAAVWLPLLALERLERKPGLPTVVLASLLCGGAVVAGAALAGAVHRAALIMAIAVIVGFAAWHARHKPLLAMLVVAMLAVTALGSDQLGGTIQQIAWKTETYGLNERSAEAAAVLDQVGASWFDLLFGQGWGTLVQSPAVGGMWVSYTHSFMTYMLLKTGLIGCLVTLAYLMSILPSLFCLMRIDPPLAVALIPPLGLGLFAHTSFKYLCFGLLLAVLTHEKIVFKDSRPSET
jgi:hypothetical protein